jgi:MerR family transcriptional regulator, heat shock protein HspR
MPPDETPLTERRAEWERTLDDPDAPLYTVGVVAELLGVDPQVVRGYDSRGIVSPDRRESGHRRYSRRDIERLVRALRLSDEGISTAGIERILDLEDELAHHDARSRLEEK